MGIVFQQTSKNIIYTYIGLAFGALNMAFLYPLFLKDTYYGLITYLTSTANVMMPLMAFGVQNALVKFYHTYTDKREQQGFTLWMFLMPLVVGVIVGSVVIVCYDSVVHILSKQNSIIKSYAWIIGALAIVYGYFEVFYAWAKLHLKSVYGNFLKEIFHRIFVTVFLILVHFNYMTPSQVIYGVFIVMVLRTALMFIGALKVKCPQFSKQLPSNTTTILKYNALMVSVGIMANILLSLDKTFVGIYLSLEDVAYYGIAVFISTIVVIPSRSMHQITYPITNSLLNTNDIKSLEKLYKKSALNIFGFSGVIFLLIMVNLQEFYKIIPNAYAQNIGITIILCIARLSENFIGNNNAIIFSSNHFRSIFRLVITTCLLSIITIALTAQILGIYGVAFAVLGIYLVYHGIKVYLVYRFFGIHPFCKDTCKVVAWIVLFLQIFCYWDFNYHPIVNIISKSILLLIGSGVYLYYFPFSKELKILYDRILRY